jgi:hypothetical protein
MPGKLCYGQPTQSAASAFLRESKAFCEGRSTQINGGSINDNPHNEDKTEATVWAAGFNAALAGDDKGCCAQ